MENEENISRKPRVAKKNVDVYVGEVDSNKDVEVSENKPAGQSVESSFTDGVSAKELEKEADPKPAQSDPVTEEAKAEKPVDSSDFDALRKSLKKDEFFKILGTVEETEAKKTFESHARTYGREFFSFNENGEKGLGYVNSMSFSTIRFRVG